MSESDSHVEEHRRSHLWRSWTIRTLSALLVMSLLLHIAELSIIIRTQSMAREQVRNLASALGQARNETFSTTLDLQQQVPVRANVPIRENMTIPISTSIDINQNISVPLDTPLGTVQVPVPLNMTVPVSTSVPIDINQTVEISTSVDLNLNVPIDIPLAETSLGQYLTDMQTYLVKLAEQI